MVTRHSIVNRKPASRGSPSCSKDPEKRPCPFRAVQQRLAQDDAEIEELERKLGIKKGRKSMPKAFKDDGLDELLDGPSERVSGNHDSGKRKHEFDDWLASKRNKSTRGDGHIFDDEGSLSGSDGNTTSEEHDDDILEADDSESDLGNAARAYGVDDTTSMPSCARPPRRENPYVAPTAGVAVVKYVPPSRRTESASNIETRDGLRRLIQGQVNRLTDDSILSIVNSVESIYQQSARSDVTELLTDTIMAQVCKIESLPDQFFVLTGGFSAAIYKIIGTSFGSHLIRRVVSEFETEYERAAQEVGKQPILRKVAYNLATFLTQLYVFQVVGSKIIFDYMERLLKEFSELNIELLLRVCRMAGKILRRDDPQALNHVSEVVSQSVSKLGYTNVSVRTKLMIEIINDLRKSKPKANSDSAIVSEHVLRMKRRLGDLKSQSRRLDGLAPMGMCLDEARGVSAHGKWWLVGASVSSYSQASRGAKHLAREGNKSGGNRSDDEDMDFVLPDYPKKARAQGLGTTAQVAIFTAIMTANNHEQGYRQFTSLGLKKNEQLEIARVLVQCVGSEAQYNEYYGQVGRLACANSRVRFAFQDRLWRVFRSLGEPLFGEEVEEEETAESERMKDERRACHIARFYASLVADGALSINILKPLELPELGQRTSSFVDRFLVSLLQACRGKPAREAANVERVFGSARETPALAAGILWFLRNRIRESRLERVRLKAQAVVKGVAAGSR